MMVKSKQKIIFINTHFLPDEKYGGVVYSGDGLFRGLADKFITRGVCTSQNPKKVKDYYLSQNLKVDSYKSVVSHKLGISISLLFELPMILRRSNFVVCNGIFTFPVTYAALLCILFKIPFSVALRGGYEPWRLNQKRRKKMLFNYLITSQILKKAAFIHVISEMEFSAVPHKYRRKTAVIPNGFDYKTYSIYERLREENQLFKDDEFNFLFLSRTDKEKGLDIIFESFKRILSLHKKARLKLIGPDNNGYLKKLVRAYHDVPHEWIPGLYGEKKILEIMKSDVLILPSYSENFGNIILESLLYGTPVITTTGTPWASIIPDLQCGWICEPDEGSFRSVCLEALSNNRSELQERGLKGQKYIIDNYSWEKIAELFSNRIKNHLGKDLNEE